VTLGVAGNLNGAPKARIMPGRRIIQGPGGAKFSRRSPQSPRGERGKRGKTVSAVPDLSRGSQRR
jgi:hypothetical protein